jgi:hypothetical protein
MDINDQITIKTRSGAKFALIRGNLLVGYAHSQSPRVLSRVNRLGAQLVPIINHRVTFDSQLPRDA